MEKQQSVIRLNYTDRELNELLKREDAGGVTVTRHYNQSEEFFLKLPNEFSVPSFPIHHDVRVNVPTKQYLDMLKALIASITAAVPDIFSGLTYFFDPTDILRPRFFQLYRLDKRHYLYLLKLDLTYRAADHELLTRSTNDATAEYRSKKLFIDGLTIPLDDVDVNDGKVEAFRIRHTVSQTWIGETGRGYFVQGIWMDHELTKFFSKLFLRTGARLYPYYPFQCRYRTVCSSVIDLGPDDRKRYPPLLHRALQFIEPKMESIQEALRSNDFSEDLPAFAGLKRSLPDYWNRVWEGLTMKPYLNEQDMKEFILEH